MSFLDGVQWLFSRVVVFGLVIGGGWMAYDWIDRVRPRLRAETIDYAWSQEIRLVVETPQGAAVGRTVQAVGAKFYPKGVFLSPGVEVDYTFSGEAAVVDLGAGRYLFALLRGPDLAERSFRDLARLRPAVYDAIIAQMGAAPREIPRDLYPRLVTFADIDDPTSVALVDPDDLAATFGEGYALEAVTIAVTNAPVTEGVVEGVLGWLPAANFIIPPEMQPRLVKDQMPEQKLMPSDFIDWRTLRDKRVESE